MKACNFIKKRLQRRCFPVSNVKFLRTVLIFIEQLYFCMKWKKFLFHANIIP